MIVLYLVLFYSLALTEGPVSVSALVGENALFHCTGSGIAIACDQWMDYIQLRSALLKEESLAIRYHHQAQYSPPCTVPATSNVDRSFDHYPAAVSALSC